MKKDASPLQQVSSPETTVALPIKRRLPKAFGALHHRNYRLYFFGQAVSLTGTWMQAIGQDWLILELTHSPWQLGLVSALQFLPVLLFSLFGGVFADRWPKRRILLVTISASTIQASLLFTLAATGLVQIWHIYGLALLLGITSSLDQPTRAAFAVELVGREDLPNAVALSSSLANLTRIIGPGLAGLIIAASSVKVLFLFNALSYLAILTSLLLMRKQELYAQAHPPEEGERAISIWRRLYEGIDYVRRTPALAWIILVVALILLFGENLNVALPIFATDVLHVGAPGLGFLSATHGIGALLAAVWLAWSNLKPTIRAILVACLSFSIVEALFAVSSLYHLSLLLMALSGIAEAIFGAFSITMLQTIPPDHLRGRVISIYIFFFTGSLPPGSLMTGWMLSFFGASTGLLICSVICILVACLGWIWHGAAERDALALTRQKSAPEPNS